MKTSDFFSSRWGIILAGLGMAVGTGNLWRFPRIAAQNGGGAFLIPWLLFLFAWSIPLLIAEFGLGRGARRGPIGAFARLTGGRTAWMGGFVAVTSVMIMFYYSVVTGWMLKYFVAAVSGDLAAADAAAYWDAYSTSVWQPVLFHVLAVAGAGFVVARGVTGGIERANRILIPLLFVLLLFAVARAVTLPGATRGLAYLFTPGSRRSDELSDLAGGVDAVGVVDRRRLGAYPLLRDLRARARRRRLECRDDRPWQQRCLPAGGDGHPARGFRHPATR